MPADVHEAAQLSLVVAQDDDRHVACPRGDIRARLRHLVTARDVLPPAAEDPLLLEPQDRRVRVPGRGQGRQRANRHAEEPNRLRGRRTAGRRIRAAADVDDHGAQVGHVLEDVAPARPGPSRVFVPAAPPNGCSVSQYIVESFTITLPTASPSVKRKARSRLPV